MTKAEAKRQILKNRGNAAFYGDNRFGIFGEEVVTAPQVFQRLRAVGYGEAEAACIVSALVLSGAELSGDLPL